MIEIITLALCGVNAVVSIILVVLFVKKGVGGFQERDNGTSGNVYCPNCCQPFSASLKNCPKCGQPKKINY